MIIETPVYRLDSKSWANQLYLPLSQTAEVENKQVTLVAIPYFAWGNRGLVSMRVWIPTAK